MMNEPLSSHCSAHGEFITTGADHDLVEFASTKMNDVPVDKRGNIRLGGARTWIVTRYPQQSVEVPITFNSMSLAAVTYSAASLPHSTFTTAAPALRKEVTSASLLGRRRRRVFAPTPTG
ncbi:MAG: hypothetical protein ACLTSX_06485 [Collinsella sp.]